MLFSLMPVLVYAVQVGIREIQPEEKNNNIN